MNYRNTHNAQQGNITPHMRGEVNQGHERSQCQRKSQALNTQSHHQNNYQHQAEYHSSNGSQQINGHTQQQAVNNVNNQQSEKRYMNLKSHGSRSAVEIAADKTAKGWNTIRLEAAAKLPTQDKKYDWNNKVSIQITKTELPCVVGVLLGYMKSCQFKNHGGDANKSFLIENQGKHFSSRLANNPRRLFFLALCLWLKLT